MVKIDFGDSEVLRILVLWIESTLRLYDRQNQKNWRR
jgi:hypothetical protein